MSGQEPHLPVDFLLGRVPEPTDGRVEDWIQEHQRQLQVAYDGPRERLKKAANCRKERHDAQINASDLPEKQLSISGTTAGEADQKFKTCGAQRSMWW